MKKTFAILLSLVVVLMFALSACGTTKTSSSNTNGGGSSSSKASSNSSSNSSSSSSSSSSTNAGSGKSKFKLVQAGKFTFAASGEYKPFSFMQGNKMVGYDIAVGDAIAKQLGLTPNPQKAKFSGIVTGIQNHRYDAAVASQTITAARLKHVNFSTPYYYSGPQIFVRPGSSIKTLADLKGKNIAVSRGSTYAKIAAKQTSNVSYYDSDVVALEALAKGRHDAVITDAITGQKAIQGGLKLQGEAMLGVSKQAVAVAKDRPELLKAVNNALATLESNGTLAAFGQKWVGTDISKAPSSSSSN